MKNFFLFRYDIMLRTGIYATGPSIWPNFVYALDRVNCENFERFRCATDKLEHARNAI